MTINVISSYVFYKNKLAIGREGDLLVHLKKDMEYFKNITTTQMGRDSKMEYNVVLMGRKTWLSIPEKNKPLKNRISFILTTDTSKHIKKIPKKFKQNKEYFMSIDQFHKIYNQYNPNVFVIGGASLYNHFIKIADNIYLTEINGYNAGEMGIPDTFMEPLPEYYKLSSYSERYTCIKGGATLTYRFLRYIRTGLSDEHEYCNLLRNVLENGKERPDRTGVGTISMFGKMMRFDISNGVIPLLTTKFVPFKSIVEEMLWMMQGSTDAKILSNKGIKIWDGNTSRSFLDKVGLTHYDEGILGAGYSWQIRHFGAKYSQAFADISKCDRSAIGGFDQLGYIEDLLRNDPFSRRIMMSYWNPSDFDKMALLPCHYQIQFYVEEIDGKRYLSALFNMRSNDLFLGNPFNIVFYTLLTQILAKRHNMEAKELIYIGGDVHIYKNHIEQVKTQLTKTARPLPVVKLADCLATKSWQDMTFDDFELIGYMPNSYIRAPMAV